MILKIILSIIDVIKIRSEAYDLRFILVDAMKPDLKWIFLKPFSKSPFR